MILVKTKLCKLFIVINPYSWKHFEGLIWGRETVCFLCFHSTAKVRQDMGWWLVVTNKSTVSDHMTWNQPIRKQDASSVQYLELVSSLAEQKKCSQSFAGNSRILCTQTPSSFPDTVLRRNYFWAPLRGWHSKIKFHRKYNLNSQRTWKEVAQHVTSTLWKDLMNQENAFLLVIGNWALCAVDGLSWMNLVFLYGFQLKDDLLSWLTSNRHFLWTS